MLSNWPGSLNDPHLELFGAIIQRAIMDTRQPKEELAAEARDFLRSEGLAQLCYDLELFSVPELLERRTT